jgi:guanine deaminase
VAGEFTDALIAQGTTSAAIFSSSHPGATDELFMALDRRGLRALSGLTLMDRGMPGAPVLDAPTALAACDDLRRRWHGHDAGRLRVAMVPRFALSCSPELLTAAGAMARQHELFVHTHISENHDEIRATLDAFPGATDYLDVYERHGLVGERTLLAHAIWLSGGEWDRVARLGAAIAHCPDSNFFLGSGCMPLRDPLARGCRVGLGTDMGAGRTFSMRRVASSAYDASLITGITGIARSAAVARDSRRRARHRSLRIDRSSSARLRSRHRRCRRADRRGSPSPDRRADLSSRRRSRPGRVRARMSTAELIAALVDGAG